MDLNKLEELARAALSLPSPITVAAEDAAMKALHDWLPADTVLELIALIRKQEAELAAARESDDNWHHHTTRKAFELSDVQAQLAAARVPAVDLSGLMTYEPNPYCSMKKCDGYGEYFKADEVRALLSAAPADPLQAYADASQELDADTDRLYGAEAPSKPAMTDDMIHRIGHALFLADVLIDAVPSRAQNSDNPSLAGIGEFVNGNGGAYHAITLAKKEFFTHYGLQTVHTATPQPEPSNQGEAAVTADTPLPEPYDHGDGNTEAKYLESQVRAHTARAVAAALEGQQATIEMYGRSFEQWRARCEKAEQSSAAMSVWPDAWHALRDDVLSGVDGFDNDQVNTVLVMLDNYEPDAALQAAQPAASVSGGDAESVLSGVKRYVCDLRDSYGMRDDPDGVWMRRADVIAAMRAAPPAAAPAQPAVAGQEPIGKVVDNTDDYGIVVDWVGAPPIAGTNLYAKPVQSEDCRRYCQREADEAAAPTQSAALLPAEPSTDILAAIMGQPWESCGNGLRASARSRYAALVCVLGGVPSVAQAGLTEAARDVFAERKRQTMGMPVKQTEAVPAGADERAAFEKWMRDECGADNDMLIKQPDNRYVWGRTTDMWSAYRAALSQRATVQPDSERDAAQQPAFWVLHSGHGNRFTETKPTGDFEGWWKPLYEGPVHHSGPKCTPSPASATYANASPAEKQRIDEAIADLEGIAEVARSQYAGRCGEGYSCVCGGDTPAVRAGCANWIVDKKS